MKVKIKGCNNCPFNVSVYDCSAGEIDVGGGYCSFYTQKMGGEMGFFESSFTDADSIWDAISEELNEDEANDWYENAFDEDKYHENWKPSFCKVQEITIKEKP